MTNYRDFLSTKKKNIVVKPSVVSTPIVGREADMLPASNGAGYAFAIEDVKQFKRWLVFGSTGSTMYANAKDITLQNLEVVGNLLAKDFKLALDIVQDFSVRNVVKGQKTLLTVLSMALAYDDASIRIYKNVDMSKYQSNFYNFAASEEYITHKFSSTVHRVSFSNDRSVLYAMIYDKNGNGNYRYEALDLTTGKVTALKAKPDNLKWYEHAFRPSIAGSESLMAFNYSLVVRRYAAEVATAMHRQSSMLFEDVANIDSQRGWGSITHRVLTNFYNELNNVDLAQQFIKYGVRQGWSHRDILRKLKPSTKDDAVRSKIFAWAVDKFDAYEAVKPDTTVNERGYIADPLTKLWAADALKHATSAKEVAKIVSDYQMPREAVERADTKWLKEAVVWEALLPSMPGVALVRNLRNMAEIGLLTPMSDAEKLVIEKLSNPKNMSRVHPMQVMQAAVTYDNRVFANSQAGNSNRTRRTNSSQSYPISQAVVNALNNALHASYASIVPTNQRIMMGVDISGSMYSYQLENFLPFYPGEAAGMMALIMAHIEPRYMAMAFSHVLSPLQLSNTSSMADMINEMNRYQMGSTNIGLPIQYAMDHKIEIDAFVSITDNEVNTGLHPSQLMKVYRQKMGIDAKFIVIAMQANNISVADPKDDRMLDIEGCSADTHDIVTNFIRGEF